MNKYESISDIVYSAFMAGYDRSSSMRNALDIYNDLPAMYRPTAIADEFVRIAKDALDLYYSTDLTPSAIARVLRSRA